jgi:DNA-directed RNA polymerase specialized sigma24 family protein
VLILTPRQVEVCVLAGCFGSWMSDKAIGRELGISAYTVRAHMADAATRIREAHPEIRAGSPRVACQAWMRLAYHTIASQAMRPAA